MIWDVDYSSLPKLLVMSLSALNWSPRVSFYSFFDLRIHCSIICSVIFVIVLFVMS